MSYLFAGLGIIVLLIFIYSEYASYPVKKIQKEIQHEKESDIPKNIKTNTTTEQIQFIHNNTIVSLFDKDGLYLPVNKSIDLGDVINLSHSNGKSTMSYDSLSFLQNKRNLSLYLDTYGNVGIGTSTPRVELDVNGSIQCSSLQVNGLFVDELFTHVEKLQNQVVQLERRNEIIQKQLGQLEQHMSKKR